MTTHGEGTYTVHLTDQEMETVRQGMTAFLHDFSHDQADTIAIIREVLARLAAAEHVEGSAPVS